MIRAIRRISDTKRPATSHPPKSTVHFKGLGRKKGDQEDLSLSRSCSPSHSVMRLVVFYLTEFYMTPCYFGVQTGDKIRLADPFGKSPNKHLAHRVLQSSPLSFVVPTTDQVRARRPVQRFTK
uniref:Uncharacterized protein n=1 Tax=Solanum tuberosum TaxID=4113 RepID=M1DPV4_SOLTU